MCCIEWWRCVGCFSFFYGQSGAALRSRVWLDITRKVFFTKERSRKPPITLFFKFINIVKGPGQFRERVWYDECLVLLIDGTWVIRQS